MSAVLFKSMYSDCLYEIFYSITECINFCLQFRGYARYPSKTSKFVHVLVHNYYIIQVVGLALLALSLTRFTHSMLAVVSWLHK